MKYTKTHLYYCLFTLISLLPVCLQAQTHEVGLRAGLANYRGELAPMFNIITPGLHAGIFYRYNPSSEIALKIGGSFSQISADDQNSQDAFAVARDYRFQTNIWELSGQIEYNFLDFRQSIRTDPQDWTPYLFAGFGVYKMEARLNPQPQYKTINPLLSMGLGLKTILGERWNIGLEFGARFAFTDYLDDLGADANALGRGNPKFYTGNPNQNDMYFFTSFCLSYVVPDPNKSCPIKVY